MKKLAILLAFVIVPLCSFSAQVPRPAPELAIPLPDGTQVKLSGYRGKVVVFAFILTT